MTIQSRLDEKEQNGGLRIVNLTPENGEPGSFDKSQEEMADEIYGIISYHRNTDGLGVSLVVAGMTERRAPLTSCSMTAE
jgi:hypothetical protein